MKKSLLLGLAIVVALVCGYYFFLMKPLPGTQPQSEIDSASLNSGKPSNGMLPDKIQGTPELKESSSVGALKLLAQSRDATEAFSEIWPLAQQGNSEAAVAIFELMSRCGQFYGEARYKPQNTSDPQSAVFSLREASIKRSSDYCNDPNGHKIAKDQRKWLRQQLTTAGKKGDEFGLAYGLSDEELSAETMLKARRLAQETKHPWVTERALLALSNYDDQAIDAKVFSSFSDTFEHRRTVKQFAAKWKACSMGGDCKPYNAFQESMCMHEGNCYSHLGMQDFLRQRLMSQTEYDQMQQYLKAMIQ